MKQNIRSLMVEKFENSNLVGCFVMPDRIFPPNDWSILMALYEEFVSEIKHQ